MKAEDIREIAMEVASKLVDEQSQLRKELDAAMKANADLKECDGSPHQLDEMIDLLSSLRSAYFPPKEKP